MHPNAMPRPHLLLAVLTLGILIGYLAARLLPDVLTRPPPPSAPTRTAIPASPDHDSADTSATHESEGLAVDETEPPRPDTPHVSDTPMSPTAASEERWPADGDSISIPRKFFSRIQCPTFNTTSNCLTDDIVELLHITTEEREKLNRLILETRTRVEDHELDRALVTEQSPNRVVLQIAANPDVGREAENAYTTGVQETLGDRASDFMERAQLYHATLFSNFGRNETTLTVTRDEASNLLRVQSRQEYNTPSGRGTSTSTTMSEKMPARWKKFFQPP